MLVVRLSILARSALLQPLLIPAEGRMSEELVPRRRESPEGRELRFISRPRGASWPWSTGDETLLHRFISVQIILMYALLFRTSDETTQFAFSLVNACVGSRVKQTVLSG